MRPIAIAASVTCLLFAARAAAPILAPLALAATLAIAFEPLTAYLHDRGAPRWLAAAASGVLILGVVVGVGLLGAVAIDDLAQRLPAQGEQVAAMRGELTGWLHAHGLDPVVTWIDERVGSVSGEQTGRELLGGALGGIQALVLIVITAVFIQLDAPSLRAGFQSRYGSPTLPTEELTEGFAEIRRYVVVKGYLSLGGGVLLGVWCALWGVEGALLWGVLAAVLNFVPVIGSLISAVPPVALALLTGGVAHALAVGAMYVAVNLVVDNIVEPRVMGRAIGLSPLVVLLSMLAWAFVLGPIGALLSVPLTIGLRHALRAAAGSPWVDAVFCDGEPAAAREP
ncbi:MAG: AI-2E family transporter [Kofleriaceae bacterium]